MQGFLQTEVSIRAVGRIELSKLHQKVEIVNIGFILVSCQPGESGVWHADMVVVE